MTMMMTMIEKERSALSFQQSAKGGGHSLYPVIPKLDLETGKKIWAAAGFSLRQSPIGWAGLLSFCEKLSGHLEEIDY
jgi:hypothetical protein